MPVAQINEQWLKDLSDLAKVNQLVNGRTNWRAWPFALLSDAEAAMSITCFVVWVQTNGCTSALTKMLLLLRAGPIPNGHETTPEVNIKEKWNSRGFILYQVDQQT